MPESNTQTTGNPDTENLVTIDLDNPAHKGMVVGRLDGQVVFVRGGLPQEKDVKVKLDPEGGEPSNKSFRTGEVVEIGQPSPYRVDPVCEAAAMGAGCCDLDFVNAQGSEEYKRDVVLDQMHRIGRIEFSEEELREKVSVTSLWPFANYRTKTRLGVDDEGRAGIRRAKSHDIVPLAEAECAQWVTGLADGLASMRFAPGSEVYVGMGQDGRRSVVEVLKQNRRKKMRIIEGTGKVLQTHSGLQWRIPVDAFWQAHMAAASHYARWVAKKIPASEGVVWDLYGGAGALSAGICEKIPEIDIVERASAATDAGVTAFQSHMHTLKQENEAAKLADIRFVDSDVKKSLGELRSTPFLHAVILDPPRTGAGKGVIPAVAKHQPNHVVHVGCDPATAARDLARWKKHGYTLESMDIVDAFGMTHHVETLMHLTRS